MSADDQQFLDLLSSIPNQIRRYSGEVADYVDKTVDKVADEIRDTLSSAQWVPDYVRPKPTARPPAVEIVSRTTLESIQDWFSRHKILCGVVVITAGYITYRSVKYTRQLRKPRRAKRARNGGRLEVVVIAGSPTLPLTKALSLDLERRGFIVYVVCNSIEDDVTVQGLSRPDIRPLGIDITDPPNAARAIERFANYLQTPHAAVPRAKPNYLVLKAVILIPSLNYQTSPIATIPPSSFADLFNTHLLHPILTIQAFLPLLTSKITPQGETTGSPRVLVFTPSIISSINPPFHAPEATVCSALSAFTEVLTAELRPLDIPVTHIQLGTFDFAGFTPTRPNNNNILNLPPSSSSAAGPTTNFPTTGFQNPLLAPPSPAETLGWPESARRTYGRNYVSQSASAISAGRIRGLRGSSLRELHNAVFDVIDGSGDRGGDVVRVGLGAGLYGFVGRWAPRGVVAWMMGIRKVDELSAWEGSGSGSGVGGSGRPGSASGSSTSEKSTGSENGVGVGEGSEFIAVAREHDGHNVWKEG
ncbi:DUF1776-domain-containing protein [Daldinia caldariorum]|uniref:DUF1776-domain-containing protein n=1 Tax=Daldinia caldariorum TaxID=326644 RepID=UPI0020073AD3|nr:DUF1776-domain-containing protein [Daldinia caldariorum]KAI1463193.1 DUF1776-domain-containing protein [Daldinia caldariorum]